MLVANWDLWEGVGCDGGRNGCSQGGRFATGILERMVRDRSRVTVWRSLVEEMLRVTVLGVLVVRVAGVAVIGMSESGVLLG
jgi:hypothetical protein